ncbi:hypothetical protein K3495_g4846 [Podosphaera aphanis]|nr:hypothetical protein K3495_g4846 [Podosphaera aphanis]
MSNSVPLASSSLDGLPNTIRNGMIALGVCGIVSLLSTTTFFLIFTYRMIHWRRFSPYPITRNQVFLLVYNLFIADMIQASGFVISFWWISQNNLTGPNKKCEFQGLLVQVGDVASGLWSLAIAIHTFINLVLKKSVSHSKLVTFVIFLWIFIVMLAAIGPIRSQGNFFTPTDAWCWVGLEHSAERLYLHYLWIFISELGSVTLYTFTFIYLRFHIKTNTFQWRPSHSRAFSESTLTIVNPKSKTTKETTSSKTFASDPFAISRGYIVKSSRYMVVYILAYLVLTLPLAAGRAANMAGIELPKEFFIGAATLMSCSGLVNVVLYISTRKLLLTTKLSPMKTDCGNRNRHSLASVENENRPPSAISEAIGFEEFLKEELP